MSSCIEKQTPNYTIVEDHVDGWWSAACKELRVSGFGQTKSEAMDSVARSMQMTLAATAMLLKRDPTSVKHVAAIVRGKEHRVHQHV